MDAISRMKAVVESYRPGPVSPAVNRRLKELWDEWTRDLDSRIQTDLSRNPDHRREIEALRKKFGFVGRSVLEGGKSIRDEIKRHGYSILRDRPLSSANMREIPVTWAGTVDEVVYKAPEGKRYVYVAYHADVDEDGEESIVTTRPLSSSEYLELRKRSIRLRGDFYDQISPSRNQVNKGYGKRYNEVLGQFSGNLLPILLPLKRGNERQVRSAYVESRVDHVRGLKWDKSRQDDARKWAENFFDKNVDLLRYVAARLRGET